MGEKANARVSRHAAALDIHKHYSVVAAVNREGSDARSRVRGARRS